MTDENIQDEKVLTNSRWQIGSTVSRYDKRQQQDVDRILEGTPGYARGARLPGFRK